MVCKQQESNIILLKGLFWDPGTWAPWKELDTEETETGRNDSRCPSALTLIQREGKTHD